MTGRLPGPPDQGPDRTSRLAAYFREHRDRFTQAALSSRAAAIGYTPEEIDAAWAKVGWGSAEAEMARPIGFGVSAFVAGAYVVGTYLGAIGLASNRSTADVTLPGLLVALLGGVLAWVALRQSNPSVARGIGCGVVITIALPAVLFLVVLGFCIVTATPTPF